MRTWCSFYSHFIPHTMYVISIVLPLCCTQFPIYIIVICCCLISNDVVNSSKPWWERADLHHYCCTEILPAPNSSADVITVLSLSGGARTCGTIVARMSIRPFHKHLPELPYRHSLQLFVVGIHLGTPLIAYGVVTGLY